MGDTIDLHLLAMLVPQPLFLHPVVAKTTRITVLYNLPLLDRSMQFEGFR